MINVSIATGLKEIGHAEIWTRIKVVHESIGQPKFFSLKASGLKYKHAIGSQDTILLNSGFKKVHRRYAQKVKRLCVYTCTCIHTQTQYQNHVNPSYHIAFLSTQQSLFFPPWCSLTESSSKTVCHSGMVLPTRCPVVAHVAPKQRRMMDRQLYEQYGCIAGKLRESSTQFTSLYGVAITRYVGFFLEIF